jgi:dipeptidyl aminopeptidase/acylaminoacyl peptidase
VAVAACGGDEVGPVTGTLQVTLSTSGDGGDPDGYLVLVNHTVQRAAPSNGTVEVEALPPGEQEVGLEGLSFNCAAQGEAVRQVTIAAGDTARVSFEVVCTAAMGTVRATINTTGPEPDPSGYTVTVDGAATAFAEPVGTTLLTVSAGGHVVSLEQVNGNCAVAEPSAPSVVVPLRGVVDLAFEVVCHEASPAGRGHEIVFERPDENAVGTLYSVNEDGSHPVRLFPEVQASLQAPAWGPDGSRLAYYDGTALQIAVADLASGGSIELPTEASFFSEPSLGWSPDGTRISIAEEFTSSSPTAAISAIHVDGSGTDLLDIGCCLVAFQSPSWSPDGSRIAFVGIEVDESFGIIFSFPQILDLSMPGVLEDPPGCDLANTSDVAWSPDGEKLALAAQEHLFILDFQTGTCTQITRGPWSDLSPSWSPDGARLAFSSTRDGNAEIYVVGADGSGLTRITRNAVADFTPAWRP